MNSDKTDKSNKRGKFFRSITFHGWLSFILLTVLIIGFMAGALTIANAFSYLHEKTESVKTSARYVISQYPESDAAPDRDKFRTTVQTVEAQSHSRVFVFTLPSDKQVSQCTYSDVTAVAGYEPTERDESKFTAAFFEKLAAAKDRDIFSIVRSRKEVGGNEITVGGVRTVGDEKVYFMISSLNVGKDFGITFFYNVFIYVAIFTLILSVFYAVVVSRLVAAPLVQFSRDVKSVGETGKQLSTSNRYSELDDLAIAINESESERKKSEEFRRDLMANVSHDMRTPLTMIKAYAEMIRDLYGDNEAKRTEHCQIIINEADTLNALVTDLLDLSKIQAGIVEFDVKPCCVNDVVRTVLERLDIFSSRDGYEFIVDCDEKCVIECDYNRIQQVVYNLIANAINYTGKDKKVFVSVKRVDGKVRFSVRDTGKGIKKDEEALIWDRYYRAKQSKRKVAGSGIGLSIVRSILIQSSARFGVIGNEGSGAEFWFEFPEYTNE